jgi:tetratricopeptide (TPR) repeat protein
MPPSLIHSTSPEREELEEKRRQLEALDEELAQRELDLATLNITLARFGYLYFRIVGVRYAELDDLESRVAALCARGRIDEAIEEYRTAILLDPGYTLARRNLSATVDKQARIEDARIVQLSLRSPF